MNSYNAISDLYQTLLDAWNRQDAAAYAAQFTEDASVVGFDGSQMNGRAEIQNTIAGIFADHKTASYVSLIREVRLLSPETGLLRAAVGMVRPGETDIFPANNAIQSLVALKQGDTWRIALFHNTPARFDGRPEAAEALTTELREALKALK